MERLIKAIENTAKEQKISIQAIENMLIAHLNSVYIKTELSEDELNELSILVTEKVLLLLYGKKDHSFIVNIGSADWKMIYNLDAFEFKALQSVMDKLIGDGFINQFIDKANNAIHLSLTLEGVKKARKL